MDVDYPIDVLQTSQFVGLVCLLNDIFIWINKMLNFLLYTLPHLTPSKLTLQNY